MERNLGMIYDDETDEDAAERARVIAAEFRKLGIPFAVSGGGFKDSSFPTVMEFLPAVDANGNACLLPITEEIRVSNPDVVTCQEARNRFVQSALVTDASGSPLPTPAKVQDLMQADQSDTK